MAGYLSGYQSTQIPDFWTSYKQRRATGGRPLTGGEMRGLTRGLLEADTAKTIAAGQRAEQRRQFDLNYNLQKETMDRQQDAQSISGLLQLPLTYGVAKQSGLLPQGFQLTNPSTWGGAAQGGVAGGAAGGAANIGGALGTGGALAPAASPFTGVGPLSEFAGVGTGAAPSAGLAASLGPAALGGAVGLGISSALGANKEWTGTITGAAIGTAIMPGVGTVLGGLLGGLVGGIF